MRRPFTARTLLLRSADGHDFVRIAALRTDAGYPSLEARVEATAKGFSGGADTWLDGFALKEFAAALRAFEKGRDGRVELRSMNADELRLVLRSTDVAGQLLCEFAVGRSVPLGGRSEDVALRVSGAFELDPATLGELAGGFTALANTLAA